MENQPTQPSTTGRQWFRLASMARQGLGQAPAPSQTTAAPAPGPASAAVASPQPTQAVAPRIRLPRPPSEKFPSQLQPPQPTTEQPRQAHAPPTTANGAPLEQARPPLPAVSSQPAISQTSKSPPTPPESLKVVKPSSPIPPGSPKIQPLQPIKTPPESPNIRQLQPIKTPPPYPEPEPKPLSFPSTLTQKGNSNGRVKTIVDINGKSLVNGDRSHIEARGPPPSPKIETAPSETGMAKIWKDANGEIKIIKLAGENTGAYMELGSLRGQDGNRKQQQGYVVTGAYMELGSLRGQDGNRKQQLGYQLQNHRTTVSGESQSEDGKSEDKKKDIGKKSVAEGKPTTARVNSNVQSINNSILLWSSSTQQSPGIHFTLVSERHAKYKGTTHQ